MEFSYRLVTPLTIRQLVNIEAFFDLLLITRQLSNTDKTANFVLLVGGICLMTRWGLAFLRHRQHSLCDVAHDSLPPHRADKLQREVHDDHRALVISMSSFKSGQISSWPRCVPVWAIFSLARSSMSLEKSAHCPFRALARNEETAGGRSDKNDARRRVLRPTRRAHARQLLLFTWRRGRQSRYCRRLAEAAAIGVYRVLSCQLRP